MRGAAILILLALFFQAAGARRLLHLDGPDGAAMMSSVYWISLLAPIFYLSAIWAASNVFARMQSDDSFGPPVVRGLKEIGVCLMIGAFAAIVVQPSLVVLFENGF